MFFFFNELKLGFFIDIEGKIIGDKQKKLEGIINKLQKPKANLIDLFYEDVFEIYYFLYFLFLL